MLRCMDEMGEFSKIQDPKNKGELHSWGEMDQKIHSQQGLVEVVTARFEPAKNKSDWEETDPYNIDTSTRHMYENMAGVNPAV